MKKVGGNRVMNKRITHYDEKGRMRTEAEQRAMLVKDMQS